MPSSTPAAYPLPHTTHSVEAADETHASEWDLFDQGPTPLGDGLWAG
jgi:hypothetical protein